MTQGHSQTRWPHKEGTHLPSFAFLPSRTPPSPAGLSIAKPTLKPEGAWGRSATVRPLGQQGEGGESRLGGARGIHQALHPTSCLCFSRPQGESKRRIFLFCSAFLFCCCCFLGPHLWHMEVPRLRGYICHLHHSWGQHQILNPLSKARDQSCILMGTSQIHFCWATAEIPEIHDILYVAHWKQSVFTN